jgi:hypothetical protein
VLGNRDRKLGVEIRGMEIKGLVFSGDGKDANLPKVKSTSLDWKQT